jgi:molybdopterin converting factor small subunit
MCADDAEARLPRVIVEFFGIARQRAGLAEIEVHAATPREAMRRLEAACPELLGSLLRSGALSREYRLSLNGVGFSLSLDDELSDGAHLLLLSADAGG